MSKALMVFPFTVPQGGEGHALDATQGIFARSLARALAERLSNPPGLQAHVATLTADGPLDGGEGQRGHGWVVTANPFTLEEACSLRLPEGLEYMVHGAAELTDRVRLRILVVDRPSRTLALDHVVLRPRSELFQALDEAAVEVAHAVGEDPRVAGWPTRDVEAYVAYLRGRDLSAAHDAGVHVADPGRSFDAYLDATRRDPTFEEAQDHLLSLALDFALGGKGPRHAARAACEQLLSIDPRAHKAHAALAEIDLEEGHLGAAEARLREALRIRPDWTPAFERLGTCLVRQRRHREAIEWFRRALREHPGDVAALVGLGLAQASSGQLEESVVSWSSALSAGAGSPDLHEDLARALHALGRRGEARVHRREARRLSGKRRFALDVLREAWQRLTGARGE